MTLRRLTLIILVAIASLWPVRGADYLRLVEWADRAAAAGKWEAAATYLQEAMRAEPGNAQNIMLLSNLGMIYFYSGKDSLALHTLTEARAMAPGSVVILANRARVLQFMGRDDDAYRDLDMVLAQDTTRADSYFAHGMIALHRGDTITASRDFRRLELLAPGEADTHAALALLASASGSPGVALPHYNELMRLNPTPEYRAARALCLLQLDRLAEAADDIAIGLHDDPDNGELYLCRALLNTLRFRPDDAQTDAAIARRLGVEADRVSSVLKIRP